MALLDSEKFGSISSAPTTRSDAASRPDHDLEAGIPRDAADFVPYRKPTFMFWRKHKFSSPQEEQRFNNHAVARRAVTRIVDECPDGYARLAAFQCSDHDLMQYRGFAYLHARLLLRLQYDIVQLEKELDRLDSFDETDPLGNRRKLYCMDGDNAEQTPEAIAGFPYRRTRPQVFAALRNQLMEYDEVLLKSKQMSLLQKPSDRDWESVRNWIMDNKPLVNQEQDFILRKEDIVTLHTGREGAMFESLVMRTLAQVDGFLVHRCKCRIIRRIFLTPELQVKTSNKLVDYYAPSRISKLVNAIVVATIFTLLVLPVLALYRLSDVGTGASALEAIGLLIVFTMLFGAAMSSMTKASRQELFAASAAYCAVLVVFISNYQAQTVSVVNWDQAK